MTQFTLPSPAQLYGNVEQQLQGYGNAQQQALQQNYQNALGMAQQQMAQSGLAGTSVAPSIKMGYMKQYQLALNNLNQQLTQTQVGAQSTFGLGGIQTQQAGQQIAQQGAAQQASANNQQGYLALAQQQAAQNSQQNAQAQAYNWQPSGDVANMYQQAAQGGTMQFS
jgi:hypothetical protein